MIRTATGSTGEAPLTDSMSRAVIVGVVSALLKLFANKTGLLSDGDLADLVPVVLAASYLTWGIYDKYVKPRLPAA